MPADSHPHSPTPEEIMAYLDGEVTPAARVVIESHLAECKECEMVADNFRQISRTAADWVVGPTPAMRAPAHAGPRTVPGRQRWRPSRFVLTSLAAAAAVILVISLNSAARRARPQTAAIASAGSAEEAAKSPIRDYMPDLRSNALARGQQRQSAIAGQSSPTQTPRTPAVIRTASLQIIAKEFSGVRAAVEAIVAESSGFIDQMTITGDTRTARTLRGTLRVPGDRLPGALARLRQLGQIVEDTQGSEDVTDQIVDLDARLASARATEQRLIELIRNRTGKLSDVLEVERELTRVRLDIERLDAEKTNVGRRVSYATIGVTIAEERKAGLDAGPLSLATRIRIAAADGLESAFESVTLTVLFLLRAGPSLVLWGAAAVSVWLVFRRIKGSQTPMASE